MRVTIAVILLSSGITFAQKKDDAPILFPIKNLFLAMEQGDSALLRKSFFTDVTLITVLEIEGKISLRKEQLMDFLTAVGSPHTDRWLEPIWDVKIEREGNFAQVWASYAFYAGTKFSHCGVDTFQLVNTPDGWKIFYLADTRNKTDCKIPEKISKQYTQK